MSNCDDTSCFLDSIPYLSLEEIKAKLSDRPAPDDRIIKFLAEHGQTPNKKELKQR